MRVVDDIHTPGVVCSRRGHAFGGGGGEEVTGGQGCEAATTHRWVTWSVSHCLCHMVCVTWFMVHVT